jgi:hypothetical protein
VYILFIGLAEIVAILLPVMINIVVFDVIFLDKYGALASAIIYTALLFVILSFNAERVRSAFQALILTAQSQQKTTTPQLSWFCGAGPYGVYFLRSTICA